MRQIDSDACACGRCLAALPEIGDELACACGRVYEVSRPGGTARLGPLELTPEKRLPIAGFSDDLKLSDDAQRYWFRHPVPPSDLLVVHVLFSASAGAAEVKAADMKVTRLTSVSSPMEAARRWRQETERRRALQKTRRSFPTRRAERLTEAR